MTLQAPLRLYSSPLHICLRSCPYKCNKRQHKKKIVNTNHCRSEINLGNIRFNNTATLAQRFDIENPH
jgi:hypothetical protein